ncbi:hypothetical protein K432DRAFT_402226 [Lepidopterella palustris CBS 459.81]|uniref:Uncharacterized protein n=1 Tax=Lepidopterella palustris CBS 459.81 TaxID=1314670 RepID=A0A8E2EG93_9PEZI|nr:hypothetical protein K432DRAFT_402226 [Lepidopterella palustris CBS 459.81]
MSEARRPLISESSDLSDLSTTPTLVGYTPPPLSPPSRSRPGYSRLRSDTTGLDGNSPVLHEGDEEGGDVGDTLRRSSGLGIATATAVPIPPGNSSGRRVSIRAIPRIPVGTRSPDSGAPLSSDPLTGGFPKGSSPGSTPDLRRERQSPKDDGDSYEEYRRGGMAAKHRSQASLHSDQYQTYSHSHDTERLRKGGPTPSIRSAYENEFRPREECPTAKEFYQPTFTWLSISILILCLFSTVFSGIFLGIALRGPRYGRKIATDGSLKPYDAIILTSVVAKTIELSFVTSFVAFLGQVLSRRAFMKEQGRGITLAEMSMWRWVVQPGTLITHFEGVRYAGATLLGILALLAALLATLYTPAASALVQPQLKFGDWVDVTLAGRVSASFANPNYVQSLCNTPIQESMDPVYAGSTCLQIEHASQGYHNYQRYLSFWTAVANSGNGTTDLKNRPQGFGLLHENTSITASWIQVVNVPDSSKKFGGRIVNNVSLAMPHSGVFQAARDPRNNIIQPEELDGLGIYSLHASVPSPVMNVLCANMNEEELAPIVYEKWPNHQPVNISWSTLIPGGDRSTTNKTVVDDLFGWRNETGHLPPVFAKIPIDFNTIMNHTSYPWGRDAIYLLGTGDPSLAEKYVLCSMKVSLSPACSTRYNATGSGGTMEAICEDPTDDLAYVHSLSNASVGLTNQDWPNIGFDWANSMSLNTGIVDANASNSRLLTQLILQSPELNKALPSPAEALAVMAGCTLLMSAQDTPFVEFWNYSLPLLETPQTQYFNASIRGQEYASGPASSSSNGFMIILILVFAMNVFIFFYFILHRGLVTDFSEPPNLFSLAVNSPPSHLLAGSCGGGPEGKQYQVNWFVNTEGGHLYMEPGEKAVEVEEGRRSSGISLGAMGLGQKRRTGGLRPASTVGVDVEMDDSPTARMYAKFAKRKSML